MKSKIIYRCKICKTFFKSVSILVQHERLCNKCEAYNYMLQEEIEHEEYLDRLYAEMPNMSQY